MDGTVMQLINQNLNLKLGNDVIKRALMEKSRYLDYVTNEEIIFTKSDKRAKVKVINKNKIEIISGFRVTFICTLTDNKLIIELRQNAEDFAEYFQDYTYFEIILNENKNIKCYNKAHTFHCLDSSAILSDKQIDKLSINERNKVIEDAVINFFENFEEEDEFEMFLDNLVKNVCIILDSDIPESVSTIIKFSNS